MKIFFVIQTPTQQHSNIVFLLFTTVFLGGGVSFQQQVNLVPYFWINMHTSCFNNATSLHLSLYVF